MGREYAPRNLRAHFTDIRGGPLSTKDAVHSPLVKDHVERFVGQIHGAHVHHLPCLSRGVTMSTAKASASRNGRIFGTLVAYSGRRWTRDEEQVLRKIHTRWMCARARTGHGTVLVLLLHLLDDDLGYVYVLNVPETIIIHFLAQAWWTRGGRPYSV